MVVKLGGLLPQAKLAEYLTFAFQNGTKQMQALAFQQSVFLTNMPEGLAERFRCELADQILQHSKRGDILRFEALAGRLPEALGAKFVLRRCTVLKRLLYPLSILIRSLFEPMFLTSRILSQGKEELPKLGVESGLLVPGYLFIYFLIVAFNNTAKSFSRPYLATAGAFLLIFLIISILLTMRSAPRRIGLSYILERFSGLFEVWNGIPVVAISSLVVGAIILGLGWTGNHLLVALGYSDSGPDTYLGSFFVVVGVFSSITALLERRLMQKLRSLKRTGLSLPALLLQSSSSRETATWLAKDKDLLRGDVATIRSFARLLVATFDGANDLTVPPLYSRSRAYGGSVSRLVRIFEERLNDALEHKSDGASPTT